VALTLLCINLTSGTQAQTLLRWKDETECHTFFTFLQIGFKTDPDPDPAFYLNADPDHKVRLCHHKKLGFAMKNILYVGNMP
jgi:hypothetical protein